MSATDTGDLRLLEDKVVYVVFDELQDQSTHHLVKTLVEDSIELRVVDNNGRPVQVDEMAIIRRSPLVTLTRPQTAEGSYTGPASSWFTTFFGGVERRASTLHLEARKTTSGVTSIQGIRLSVTVQTGAGGDNQAFALVARQSGVTTPIGFVSEQAEFTAGYQT